MSESIDRSLARGSARFVRREKATVVTSVGFSCTTFGITLLNGILVRRLLADQIPVRIIFQYSLTLVLFLLLALLMIVQYWFLVVWNRRVKAYQYIAGHNDAHDLDGDTIGRPQPTLVGLGYQLIYKMGQAKALFIVGILLCLGYVVGFFMGAVPPPSPHLWYRHFMLLRRISLVVVLAFLVYQVYQLKKWWARIRWFQGMENTLAQELGALSRLEDLA
jgi:hypothetical protein